MLVILLGMCNKHQEAKQVLLEGLNEMYDRGTPDYAIIHFYIHCEGMETDFIFSGAGANRTMKQLRHGNDLDEIIDKFAQMIQSGKNVSLDDHTRIIFSAFIPPMKYR